jgi:hypothetical protein
MLKQVKRELEKYRIYIAAMQGGKRSVGHKEVYIGVQR